MGDCKEKAAELGFDLTKQFLSIALAAIAFIVGLTFSAPGTVSTFWLWTTIAVFGASAILGFLFLMHGVNLLSIQNTYDIYASSLRFLAGLQIVFVLAGVILLVPIVSSRPSKATPAGSLEVKLTGQQSIVYPIDPDKNTTIEVDGGKIKITATK